MPELTSRVRDHRLDAAKGVLICLVVFGHLLEQTSFWDAGSIRLPLTAIYLFHMPAFVFLAGVTAKTTRLVERAGSSLVLLLAFQGLYFGFDLLIESPQKFTYFPFWTLWFLLSMVYWQLLLPVILKLRGVAMAGSVVLALGVGFADGVIGNDWAVSRALVFLPFYAAGALYGHKFLALASRTSTWLKAGLVVASGAVAWVIFSLDMEPGWFFGNRSYAGLGDDAPDGVFVRAGLLAVAALMTFTLLCLIPNRVGTTTAVGRSSLAVYLFHGFVVMAVTPLMPLVWENSGRWGALALCALFTVVIVAAFSRPVFDKALRVTSQTIVRLVTAPLADRPKSSRETPEKTQVRT